MIFSLSKGILLSQKVSDNFISIVTEKETRRLLWVDQVFKNYGNREVLKGISFTLWEGQCLSLLGPNGVGKTSLVKILLSLESFHRGKIEFHEELQVPKSLGYAPQTISYWQKLTVLENLFSLADLYSLPKDKAKLQSEDLLHKLGLWQERDKRIEYLSGGMQRRFNLAMATVHSPKLLILDEPTANLDQESKRLVFTFLEGLLHEGISLLYTSHDLEELSKISDQILFLRNGTVAYTMDTDKYPNRDDRYLFLKQTYTELFGNTVL
ncbi:ABC transporter, ATP binding protein [Leptospira ryugenii]|uniref:ABC transporter, ATP binding protein n=1 Tax=Leptospira ryugenii TaxID=1917863 RepID=A0A2P2DYH3_9LEPT|nr:ABC transporter ATP-binding protein [Leptospira ryugenii]GBF49662.1 ABC transporter, ATP binding protein [Leptospira ryugenii]